MDLKTIDLCHFMTPIDTDLSQIGPITGKLTRDQYEKIVLLIYNLSNTDYAKTAAKTVTELKSQKLVSEKLDLIREWINSKNPNDFISQITFGKDVTQQMSYILLEYMRNEFISQKKSINPTKIVLDRRRCELLLYKEGGLFDYQRKFVPDILPMKVRRDKSNQKYEWRMYSMIIVLDSNLNNTVHNLSGCTVVNLPPRRHDLKYMILDRTRFLTPHVYPQTRMPMNWVIFPAQALHKSIVINQIDGFNMALKFDVWFREKLCLPMDQILTPFSKECHCILCRPHKFVVHELNFWLKLLPCELNTIIAQYAVECDEPPCRCRCNCPCEKCDYCH